LSEEPTPGLRILLLRVREVDQLGSAGLAANDYVERQAVGAIVQKLGCLPLALDQAGAYIHMQQYSFSRYLREYKERGKWKVGKQHESVIATLELSFDAIQGQMRGRRSYCSCVGLWIMKTSQKSFCGGE